jgi:hypothetical protein
MPTMTRAVARRPSFRRGLYLAAFVAIAAWLLVCNGALAILGAPRLAEVLGERFFNTCVVGAGLLPCLLLMLAAVLVDALTSIAAQATRRDRSLARRFAVPAACVALVGAVVWCASVSLDPLTDYALLPLAGERTEYAAGYSASAFAAIGPGSSWDEVRARLGEPLDAAAVDGVFVARWSRGVGGSSYWERLLIFDREGGHVLRRDAGLYVS